MARLVIVSNRVPDSDERARPHAGGLVVSLAGALVPGTLWFGWSGRRADMTGGEPHRVRVLGIDYATIDLSEADYRGFYLGFASGTLWPLFHAMPSLTVFERGEYAAYRQVNQAFAANLQREVQADDLIWVHDYQLIEVAQALRERGIGNRIGFFLHVPFPPRAILEIIPPAEELLIALLAHDLVGFQTERDRGHFMDAAQAVAGVERLDDETLCHQGRCCRVIVARVGIDADAFHAMAERASRRPETKRMRDSLAGRALMIGVDRLDYTKGLPGRFEAFGRFLSAYPEHRRQISFLQIAAPSREEVDRYRALREELDHKTGAINGSYSDFDWVPLRYMTRTIRRGLIAGFYRNARIGLVTPLRDGMNLVAKEYIAAQDAEDPGVLILSCFAGAAEALTDALVVNPFDVDGVAEAIRDALIMPRAERQARHEKSRERVRTESASAYCRRFCDALAQA